LDRVFDYGSKG